MERFTVFISSTVKDLGPIRTDLRRWFETEQADVRTSESPGFPVDDGVSSHDACLRAIEGCHLAIVLIGARKGGPYVGTPKSITQREYEEALRMRIPTIVLVTAEVNAQAELWSKGELRTAPFGRDTADVVRFIDRVRKGHTNNWFHPTWDGSFHGAREIIRARMNALFVRYQSPHSDVLARAKRLSEYAAARRRLDLLVHVTAGTRMKATERLSYLLDVVAEERKALLGFGEEDLWNFAIYVPQRSSGPLRVLVRKAHSAIQVRNRTWKAGQGHVGACWSQRRALIAPDLTVTDSWNNPQAGDETYYRSAMAEPIVLKSTAVMRGVLVATSSRLDHFRDTEQPEVTTWASLAFFVSQMIRR